MYRVWAAGVTLTMQDYEQMPARDRDDLILLRVSIDERRERLERDAMKRAEKVRKRGR